MQLYRALTTFQVVNDLTWTYVQTGQLFLVNHFEELPDPLLFNDGITNDIPTKENFFEEIDLKVVKI